MSAYHITRFLHTAYIYIPRAYCVMSTTPPWLLRNIKGVNSQIMWYTCKWKRCSKKKCFKQYGQVKFMGTMTKWPVQEHTEHHKTRIHSVYKDATLLIDLCYAWQCLLCQQLIFVISKYLQFILWLCFQQLFSSFSSNVWMRMWRHVQSTS